MPCFGHRAGIAAIYHYRGFIAESLTGAPGDAREAARWCWSEPVPAFFATTVRFRRRSFRAISRLTLQVRAAAGPKASSGSGWSARRASTQHDHASYYRVDGLDRWPDMARQTDPVGRTDRGYCGVSRNAARMRRHDSRCAEISSTRRRFLGLAAAPRTISVIPIVSLHPLSHARDHGRRDQDGCRRRGGANGKVKLDIPPLVENATPCR